MAVTGLQVSVAATATLLATPGNGGYMAIANRGANPVFLGASDVTTGTGYELAVNDFIEVPVKAGQLVYGIVAAATEDVHVLLVD